MPVTLALVIGVLALAVPAGAGAHVRVQPEEVEAGAYTVLHVNVPNESQNLATTKVVLEFPPGFSYALYRPVAGWSGDVTMTKAAKSIIGGQRTPAGVGRVTWTARQPGAEIRPDQFEEFPIAVQAPDAVGKTLTFKATQTYENGDVVRWGRWPGLPGAGAAGPRHRCRRRSGGRGGG